MADQSQEHSPLASEASPAVTRSQTRTQPPAEEGQTSTKKRSSRKKKSTEKDQPPAPSPAREAAEAGETKNSTAAADAPKLATFQGVYWLKNDGSTNA